MVKLDSRHIFKTIGNIHKFDIWKQFWYRYIKGSILPVIAAEPVLTSHSNVRPPETHIQIHRVSLTRVRLQRLPAYNEGFLCIKIIDGNVEKFGYYEHASTTSSFLCIYLLVLSGTECNSRLFTNLLTKSNPSPIFLPILFSIWKNNFGAKYFRWEYR